jgi:acylphosphatase
MSAVRAHVVVSGRVQGVGYRASCFDAVVDDVAGWVRNLPDGRVEAVFEGDREQVEKAIAWCRRGPPSARVTDVAVSWEEPKGERGFRIAH